MIEQFITPTGNATILKGATQQEIIECRQQHRNVFAERCRLAGVRCPDESTMLAWWPGTKAVFG